MKVKSSDGINLCLKSSLPIKTEETAVAKENSLPSTSLDFSGLILGFSSAALYYLGENSLEGRPVGSKNLPLARQNIDIILMLREKTKGNLSIEEEKLMQQLVTDLQLKMIAATNSSQSK